MLAARLLPANITIKKVDITEKFDDLKQDSWREAWTDLMGGGLTPSPPEALRIVQSTACTMPKILHTFCKKMKVHQVWGGGQSGKIVLGNRDIGSTIYFLLHFLYILLI